jgi:hypothetical protein
MYKGKKLKEIEAKRARDQLQKKRDQGVAPNKQYHRAAFTKVKTRRMEDPS